MQPQTARENWDRVKALFEGACNLPADARGKWLDEHCVDPIVRVEVDALLESHDEEPDFLEETAGERFPEVVDAVFGSEAEAPDAYAGRTIGPYRVERLVGEGGMGAVYEALQKGADFERRVAIKVVRSRWAIPSIVERFRFERRILGRLEHPGIARLYDAGATEDGVPYFVMEFVDGVPVDEWCKQQNLDLKSRVRLFLRICGAVEYAHRNLVVHRDLKPGNILVTAEGEPKLLDFGVAKVVTEDVEGTEPGLTGAGARLFTPEYASPEQVQGQTVTTASDVYSLGALLYVLLAGRRPFELQGISTLEAMRVVVEKEPTSPSRMVSEANRPAIEGDLDNIVLRCLRKSPTERYESVRALEADLEAWLDGRPVAATPPSPWYSAKKWVGRNKVPAVALGVAGLAVIGGSGATAWQAHQARIERDEALYRVGQVKDLSRALLFDVHDAVRRLPGSTETRKLVLSRGVQFLDGLSRTAAQDPKLALDLAEGYARLGNIQGHPASENIGDEKGALESYRKGIRLAEEVVSSSRPGDAEHRLALMTLIQLGAAQGVVSKGGGDAAALQGATERLKLLLTQLEQSAPESAERESSLGAGYIGLATLYTPEKKPEAIQQYELAVRHLEKAERLAAPSTATLTQRATALKRWGALLIVTDQLDAAEGRYRQALAIEAQLLARDTTSLRLVADMSYTKSDLSLILRRRGELPGAESLMREVVETRAALVQKDPKDLRMRGALISARRRLAGTLAAEAKYPEAIRMGRETVQLADISVAEFPSSRSLASSRAWANLELVDMNLGAGNWDEATRAMARARELVKPLKDPDIPPAVAGLEKRLQSKQRK